MRTKSLLLVLCVIPAIISSCVKSHIEKKEKEPENFTELTVPSNFNWKMSTNVSCNFTSEYPAKVYISTAANKEPFASFYVGQDVEQVTLNVPSSINTLYVKYDTETGQSAAKALEIINNTVTYAVPTDSKEIITPVTTLAKMSLSRANEDNTVIYYPAINNGWGTLLFEDLWPAYGDYDFNDLVVNYKIQLYPNNKNMINAMLLGIRVKAVGGYLPYDFCLTIKGIKAGEIGNFTLYNSSNTPKGADMELLNPGNNVKNPPVFRFNNIKKNPHAPQEYSFLNTDRNQEARLQESDMVNISFYIEFRNSIPQRDLNLEAFDFFIAQPYNGNSEEWQEIHTGGNAPTKYGNASYAQIKEGDSNIGESSEYYHSNTNLVWAINIPADIPHAYENIDFLKAYPHFKDWASSGGTQYPNWYENIEGYRVKDNLVTKGY